jgi:hypothetical protein
MSKKTRLTLVVVLTLLALFLWPGVSFASSPSAVVPSNTSKVNAAFTGLVTSGATKGAALTGGLTIAVRDDGSFDGNLHLPEGTRIPVSGQVKSDGAFNITFHNVMGIPIIKGVGQLNSSNEFVGTFAAYDSNDKRVAGGIWSAPIVSNPEDVLALAFVGNTLHGPDAGVSYSGAIIVGKENLRGTFNLPDGTLIPVRLVLQDDGERVTAIFKLDSDTKIVGNGSLVTNPANDQDKGYAGPFHGPKMGDAGKWVAYFFGF